MTEPDHSARSRPRLRGWGRRRSAAATATTRVCPSCRTAGPAQLRPGQTCAACEAQTAWSQLGDGGCLVIDRDTIAAAVRRRQGEAAGEPVWRRLLVLAPPAVTLAMAVVALWCLRQVLAPRALGPLRELISSMLATLRWAMGVGALAVIAGVVALVRSRRRRHFRKIPLVVCHLLAIVAGCSALVTAYLHSLSLDGGFAGRYLSMPARAPLGVPAHVERIVDATVVVLAPDGDGDARGLAMGTGAVVARDSTRAWIVTCSHVAMPYSAVGAWRHARDAQPVWVQLSDGRESQAAVRWAAPPPLDVALVELAIANAPEPVAIAHDTSELSVSSAVTFVPNPYRAGWRVTRGELVRRETHRTSAGSYDMLYTDLPVIFGDSGSGLYDALGRLVGLNTWTRLDAGTAQGISLPSETMRVLVEAISRGTLDNLDDAVLPPPKE
jgi:S1-C subfamily serine protease